MGEREGSVHDTKKIGMVVVSRSVFSFVSGSGRKRIATCGYSLCPGPMELSRNWISSLEKKQMSSN